mgnify:CR=1 FL=1
MTLSGFFAVGIGAALGAWLRWIFGIVLNPLLGNILLGTLTANLVGGFLIGVAVEYFVHHDSIPPEWRLFVIVGFLGGLTTFSSFSAEAVELLSDRDFLDLVGATNLIPGPNSTELAIHIGLLRGGLAGLLAPPRVGQQRSDGVRELGGIADRKQCGSRAHLRDDRGEVPGVRPAQNGATQPRRLQHVLTAVRDQRPWRGGLAMGHMVRRCLPP